MKTKILRLLRNIFLVLLALIVLFVAVIQVIKWNHHYPIVTEQRGDYKIVITGYHNPFALRVIEDVTIEAFGYGESDSFVVGIMNDNQYMGKEQIKIIWETDGEATVYIDGSDEVSVQKIPVSFIPNVNVVDIYEAGFSNYLVEQMPE